MNVVYEYGVSTLCNVFLISLESQYFSDVPRVDRRSCPGADKKTVLAGALH